ncbi:Flp family type IVb pilin [Pseudomonas sp. TMW22089]|uniref:Flp family type IVb pilin n=1 Tax=Pseudomonas sp. TMW22089 TaxID=2506433 RepID=UPI001F0F17F9|nr:Flp family type IVb pilin [Pseudomonas sp. TMW22089]MCH4867660.1 Flp family type IVb pilin [Pseudomonas sp. TMW22089]
MFLNTVLKVYVPTQLFVARQVKLFAQRTEGASGIEYALIAGMVAVAIITIVTPIKTAVTSIFQAISTELTSVAG